MSEEGLKPVLDALGVGEGQALGEEGDLKDLLE
jgi:hypothetical protein